MNEVNPVVDPVVPGAEGTPDPTPTPTEVPTPAPAELGIDPNTPQGDDLSTLYDTDNFKVNDLNVPDGMDEASVKGIAVLAKEQGFTQTQAQSLLDVESQRIADHQGNPENWVQMIRDDPEMGGKNFETNMGIANQGLASMNDLELNRQLRETGLGNHPSFVRLMFKIGQAQANDSFITGKQSSNREKTLAEKLYPQG